MAKDSKNIILGLLIAFFALVIFSISFIASPPLKYTTIRVRVDSIGVDKPYDFIPETRLIYFTKYGHVFHSGHKAYCVGDSIDMKIVKIIK